MSLYSQHLAAVISGGSEESKESSVPRQEIEARVERIMAQIEPQVKKVDKSKDFRAFMKTAKADVKDGDSEKVL